MTRTLARALLCGLLLALPGAAVAADDKPKPPDPNAAIKKEVRDFTIDAGFDKALARFEELAGVKIIVDWAALAEAGIKPTDPVSVKADKATVQQLLKMTLAGLEGKDVELLTYVDGPAVRITTKAAMLRKLRLAKALGGPKKSAIAGAAGRFEFEDVPLSDVIGFLRDASGANFHVNWKALNLVGIERNTPVTLKATGINFEQALDILIDGISGNQDKLGRVYWIIDDGIVKVSTGQAFNDELRTKIYDVTDLLVVVPNFQGPRMNPTSSSSGSSNSGTGSTASQDSTRGQDLFKRTTDEKGAEKDSEDMSQRRQKARDDLVGIIRSTVGADMWQEGGGKGSVKLIGNKLVVCQTLLGFKLMEQAIR